jgi:hypothetical protein
MPKNFTPQDQYFKKAKELGYRARSAFKLEELQKMSSDLVEMVHRVRAGEGNMEEMLEKWVLGV